MPTPEEDRIRELIRNISRNGIIDESTYREIFSLLSNLGITISNDNLSIAVNSANQTMSMTNNINTGLLSNIIQEILVKKDELIKLQNEDLTNQLRNLEAIQSNIENKNVIIDQINYNMEVQQNNIIILKK